MWRAWVVYMFVMAHRELSKLALDKYIKTNLSKTSLKTIKDVVLLPPLAAMNLLHLSIDQYKDFMDNLLNFCVPPKLTAYELEQMEQRNNIPLGGSTLDALLHGGLLPGSLTEFVGPPGVGKTQWCLYISAMVVATGKEGDSPSAIYLDTESAVRPERIVEIIKNKYPKLSSEIPRFLSRIHVFQPKTAASMLEILDSLEFIVVEKDARVVIVDSITSVARCMLSSSSGAWARQLSSWAAKLKSLAYQLNICVVVTNQIIEMLEPQLPEPDLPEMSAATEKEDHMPDKDQVSNMQDKDCMPNQDQVSNPKDQVSYPKNQVFNSKDPKDQVPDPVHYELHPKEQVSEPKGQVPDPKDQMPDSEKRVQDPEDKVPDPVDCESNPEDQMPDLKDQILDPKNQVPDREDCVSEQDFVPDENNMPWEDHVPGPADMEPDPASYPEGNVASEETADVIPALGNTWTHCITSRLILQYTDSSVRELVIAKSPVSPFASFKYIIRRDGIAIDEEDCYYTYSGQDPGLFRIRVEQAHSSCL